MYFCRIFFMTMMENKAQQFLERYREIEEWVLNNLNVAEMKDLEQMPQYKSLRSNLSFCRILRNLLSHYDWSKAGNDMVIVTDQALRQVNNLYYSLNPVTLMRIAIRVGQIYAPASSDSVLNAIKVMHRNDYSYIPIVDNHRIVGVFSIKILLRIAAEDKIQELTDSLTFLDILDFIRISENPENQYSFIDTNTTVEDAAEMFQRSKRRKKKLDVLFITDNGRADGTLQGMLTPTDLIGTY